MKVEGGTTGGWNAGAVPAGQGDGGNDTVSKNLKKQIESAQNELKSIFQNKDMPPEEKAERSKQLRQEIADLKRQLTQHQIEKQKEQREQRAEQKPKQKPVKKGEEDSLNAADMQGLLAANASLTQADTMSSVKTKEEDKARILKTEIKLDGGRRGSSGLKEKELAETGNNISNLEGKIGGQLKEAVKHADEAGAEVKKGQREEDEEKRADEDKSLISGIRYYKKIDVLL